MDAHSDISSRNVLLPIARLSAAPMRVCTPSNGVSVIARAGAKLPHCAINTSRAV